MYFLCYFQNETDLKIAKILETKEYQIKDVEVKLEENAQKLKLLERKEDLGIEDFMINYKVHIFWYNKNESSIKCQLSVAKYFLINAQF